MNTLSKFRTIARHRVALFSLTAAVLLAGCSSLSDKAPNASCKSDAPNVVCTTQGAVAGVTEGSTVAFKGIPYAAPPVGDLRWKPPQPVKPWNGVLDASKFGAVCPQMAGQAVVGNEDCLTLNVWRPQGASTQPRAVMVFLTGGGNHLFSGQGSQGFGGVSYDGEMLVRKDVVYVSFNNRLGAFGFLAHPTLDGERREKVSGNYGSLDQIAVLKWIQQNIAAFGGDPKRVMLFGTSAGGGSICALMTAPAARGLFHRASMQSSVPTGCQLQTLADAENGTGRQVAQKLGCDGDTSSACLRSKSAEDIVRALPGTFGLQARLYGPNVDGHVFPVQPINAIRRGDHSSMPVIIGNSAEETMQWAAGLGPVSDAASYDAAIVKGFGAAAAPRIREAYPMASYPTPHAALVKVTTDAFFTCQSLAVARALGRSQQQPVYRYVFNHALQNDPELKAQGATHTIEHPFFFGWKGKYTPNVHEIGMQMRMIGDWTNMARSGTVQNNEHFAWWPFSQDDAYLEITEEPAVKQGDAGAKCGFWDTVKLPPSHL